MDLVRLIAEARTGDADSFTELVRRYQAMAYGSAYAFLDDAHLAEDAAQLAFFTAYTRLHNLEHPERFGAWLRGIVRFECLHLQRRRHLAEVPLERAEFHPASTPEPAQVIEEQEGLDELLAAIAALPPVERESTVLYYLQEKSQREVAMFLDVPVSTVNNRLRSARKRLKQGGFSSMQPNGSEHLRLPEDFAERIGELIRTQGPVIDARFAPDHLPRVLDALTIVDAVTGSTMTAQVAQHIENDTVRSIVVGSGTPILRPGMPVTDTASPIQTPLDHKSIAQAIRAIRRDETGSGVLETGIKVIDLLCPLPTYGVIGLVGDMRAGKMVLVEELITRLSQASASLSIIVFVETTREVEITQRVDYRTSASVEAIYLPVVDASSDALRAATAELDAVLTLSSELAQQGRYPAIAPLHSSSRLFKPAVVDSEHNQVAGEVRQLLNQASRLGAADRNANAEILRARARHFQSYFTQPFFVAEAFTNRAGTFVPRAETIADCSAILDGSCDGVSDDALRMIGSLVEAGLRTP